MNNRLKKKIILIASEICWMHGSIAGDRTYGEWTGDEEVLNLLSESDREFLSKWYGEEEDDIYFTEEEMSVCYIVARALKDMVKPDEEVVCNHMWEKIVTIVGQGGVPETWQYQCILCGTTKEKYCYDGK